MAKIDTRDSHIPIWLVWSLHENGNTILHAICLTQDRAAGYRKVILRERKPIKVWVEPRLANHLYAGMFTMTGDEELGRLIQQGIRQLEAARKYEEETRNRASRPTVD